MVNVLVCNCIYISSESRYTDIPDFSKFYDYYLSEFRLNWLSSSLSLHWKKKTKTKLNNYMLKECTDSFTTTMEVWINYNFCRTYGFKPALVVGCLFFICKPACSSESIDLDDFHMYFLNLALMHYQISMPVPGISYPWFIMYDLVQCLLSFSLVAWKLHKHVSRSALPLML